MNIHYDWKQHARSLLLLNFLIGVIFAVFSVTVFSQDIERPIRLPAIFQEELIFLQPVTETEDSLLFFTDTADASLMYRETVDRLGLITTDALIQDNIQRAAFLPPFDATHFIPPPLISDGLIPVRDNHLKPPHHEIILQYGDGILGSTWFAERTWSINFRKKVFYIRPTDDYKDSFYNRDVQGGGNFSIPLHFYEEGGKRSYHFARLSVIIAEDTLSLVLKTGSHIELRNNVQNEMGRDKTLIAAGLISESVFEQWRKDHPDWPVFEAADVHYGSALIKVPEVTIGDYSTGPVRFAVRRNEAFQEWFSQFTDEPVVGALGPDAFRDAHITLDYPNALLIFHD